MITDVLPDGALPAEGLLLFHRSRRLRLVARGIGFDYPIISTLRDVVPRSLWSFPGHPAINDSWFRHILLFDTGEYDLIIFADLAEDAQSGRHPRDKYEAGEFIVEAGTRLVVGEAGIVWSSDQSLPVSETIIEWAFVGAINATSRDSRR